LIPAKISSRMALQYVFCLCVYRKKEKKEP
jgi:hypothetical protein